MLINKCILCVIFILLLDWNYKVSCILDELFLNADEIMNSEIGDPLIRPGLRNTTAEASWSRFLADMPIDENMSSYYKISLPALSTSTPKATPLTTPRIREPSLPPGFTVKEMKLRMKQRHLRELLTRRENYMQNIQGDTDDIEEITKLFIQAKENKNELSFRRTRDPFENYPYAINPQWNDEKIRLLKLFHSWIYRTQFILVHAQKMRSRYISSVRFKLGYCFALLTELKRTEMLIFFTYYFHYIRHQFLMWHLQIYEKMNRLDIDIKNVVMFIKVLEEKREEYEQRESAEIVEYIPDQLQPPPG